MKAPYAFAALLVFVSLFALPPEAAAEGQLLLRSYPSDLLLARGGKQLPLPTPAPLTWFAKVEFNDPAHLVIFDRSASNKSMEPDRMMVVDLKTQRGRALAAPRKRVRRNQIIKFLRFMPSSQTFAFFALDNYKTALFLLQGSKRRPIPALRRIRGHTFGHQMFADGQLLFVHDPSFQKARRVSIYYAHTSPGARQTIYLAESPTKAPQKLLTRGAFLDVWLTNQGKHLVFLEPGRVDEAGGRRGFRLQALDLASKKVTLLTTLSLPIRGDRGTWRKDSPKVYVFLRSPYVAVANGKSALRVFDLASGKERALALPTGFALTPLVPTRGKHPNQSGTTFHPYVVAKRWVSRGVDELVVLRVPDGKKMLRHTYRGRGVQEAVYLP